MSPPAEDLILRAEIPELGIRKAIRILSTDTARQVLDQLAKKANLSADFMHQCRIYRSAPSPPSPTGSGTASDHDYYESEPLSWSYCDWKNHADILLRRPDLSKSAPPSRSNSFRIQQQQQHSMNSQLYQQQLAKGIASSFLSVAPSSLPDSNIGDSSEVKVSGIHRRFPNSGSSLEELLMDTKKMTIKKIGRLAQSLNPSAPGSLLNPRKAAVCTIGNSKSSSGAGHVFGLPLATVQCNPVSGIPFVVEKLLDFIEQKEMNTEGIFRLSGASSMINQLKEAFDHSASGGKNLNLCSIPNVDGHTVASLLKLFLRELPDPLLTYALYDAWVAVQNSNKPHTRVIYLQTLVRALPRRNYLLLCRLCRFFKRLTEFTDENKMTFQNIATVLGPNILRSQSESASIMVHNAGAVNTVALELVKNADQIFSNPQYWSSRTFSAAKPEGRCLCIGRAAYSYAAQYGEVLADVDRMYLELSFNTNQYLMVWAYSTSLDDESAVGEEDHEQGKLAGWWIAELLGSDERQIGIIPSNYLEIIWRADPTNENTAVDVTQDAVKPKQAPKSVKQLVIDSSSSSPSEQSGDETAFASSASTLSNIIGIRKSQHLPSSSPAQSMTTEKSAQTAEDPVEVENRSLRIKVRELEKQIAFLQSRITPDRVNDATQTEAGTILANCPRPPPPILAPPPPAALSIRTSVAIDKNAPRSTSPSPSGRQLFSSRSVRRMPPPPPPASAFPERNNLLYVGELLAKFDGRKSTRSPSGSLTPPAPLDSVDYPAPHPRQSRTKSGHSNRHSIAGPIMSTYSDPRRNAHFIEHPPVINFPAPPATPPLTTSN